MQVREINLIVRISVVTLGIGIGGGMALITIVATIPTNIVATLATIITIVSTNIVATSVAVIVVLRLIVVPLNMAKLPLAVYCITLLCTNMIVIVARHYMRLFDSY